MSHLTIEEVQLIGDGESEPNAHVRDCARSASAIVGAMQMKRAVRDVMRGDPAPASLRRRIRRDPLPRWTWLAAAAAVVAIVIAAFAIPRRSSALAELADMHATMLASANPVDVISTDKHTVKPWFEGRVPFAVPVPDLTSTPFRLIGGRVVYLRGNQLAYLLIGKGAHRISVFISPQKLDGAARAEVSTRKWNDGVLDYVAIGDVPASDLAQLRGAFTR